MASTVKTEELKQADQIHGHNPNPNNQSRKLNICLTHYRVGLTDGVSLEMDKHKKVFEQMGYNVIYLAGIAGHGSDCHTIPEMDYRTKDCKLVYHNAYEKLDDFKDGNELNTFIFKQAKSLENKLIDFFNTNQIDLIICHNIFSHALHPILSIAMTNAIKECNIKKAIGYHHDFYWERDVFDNPTCDEIVKITDEYVPPLDTNVYKHCTINSIGANTLLNKKKLASTIIPNVFDYETDELWVLDDYNKALYDELGIDKNGDIVVLQATRIMKRKAIELAIQVVKQMVDISGEYKDRVLYNGKQFTGKIHFMMPGLDQEFDRTYVNYLDTMMAQCGAKIHKISDIVGHVRAEIKDKNDDNNVKKQYSLWDTYVISDLVTYPSIQEGWGNQYLEGIFAKKPQLLFEYPVYTQDIKTLGFKNIELGSQYKMVKTDDNIEIVNIDSNIIVKAAKECMDILFNKDEYNSMVEHNFEVAKKSLSYTALRKLWEGIFDQYNEQSNL